MDIQVTPKEKKREWGNENWTRLIGHKGFTKGKKGNGEMKIGQDLLDIQVTTKEKRGIGKKIQILLFIPENMCWPRWILNLPAEREREGDQGI